MTRVRFNLAGFAIAAFAISAPLLAQQAGTVEGHVKLTGTPPANARIPMGADPNCLTINAGKKVAQETVLRAADGSLANVFAFAKGPFAKSGAASPAVIDQRGCTYHPRIQGAQVGQTLDIRNSDGTLHNIHSMTTKNNSFNTGQPNAGMVFHYVLKSEEVMLHVKCDVHPWMTGYIGVVNHPYYAVSDAAGNFRITGVPAGRQTITVWHEQYGPLTQVVDVKTGVATKVEFAYTGLEKPAPSIAGLRTEEVLLPGEATAVELVAPGAR
jgi:plastocyanin